MLICLETILTKKGLDSLLYRVLSSLCSAIRPFWETEYAHLMVDFGISQLSISGS